MGNFYLADFYNLEMFGLVGAFSNGPSRLEWAPTCLEFQLVYCVPLVEIDK